MESCESWEPIWAHPISPGLPSMALDSRDYRDPAEVAEERESRTCKGCIHVEVIHALGSLHQVCKIHPRRTVGRRCRAYTNPTEDA